MGSFVIKLRGCVVVMGCVTTRQLTLGIRQSI